MSVFWNSLGAGALALATLTGCNGAGDDETNGAEGETSGELVRFNPDPYPSTYQPAPSGVTLIRGANVFDGVDQLLENTDILIENGRIAAIGQGLAAPRRG